MLEADFAKAELARNHVLLFTSALVPKALASILTSFVLYLANRVSYEHIIIYAVVLHSYVSDVTYLHVYIVHFCKRTCTVNLIYVLCVLEFGCWMLFVPKHVCSTGSQAKDKTVASIKYAACVCLCV